MKIADQTPTIVEKENLIETPLMHLEVCREVWKGRGKEKEKEITTTETPDTLEVTPTIRMLYHLTDGLNHLMVLEDHLLIAAVQSHPSINLVVILKVRLMKEERVSHPGILPI